MHHPPFLGQTVHNLDRFSFCRCYCRDMFSKTWYQKIPINVEGSYGCKIIGLIGLIRKVSWDRVIYCPSCLCFNKHSFTFQSQLWSILVHVPQCQGMLFIIWTFVDDWHLLTYGGNSWCFIKIYNSYIFWCTVWDIGNPSAFCKNMTGICTPYWTFFSMILTFCIILTGWQK